MEPINTQSQLEMSRNVHDLGSINKMREAIASGDDKVLREAANQFEAIFVQMMLKSMRKAQDALSDENSPFNSEQMKFYRDMHDQQLATDLSSGKGMGLADLIVKQLGQQDDSYTPGSLVRSDGNLNPVNQASRDAVNTVTQNMLDSASKGSPSAHKAAMFETPQDFVAAIRPHAEQVAKELGVDPKAIISQAAVETGWGKFVIHDKQGNSSHNLFGIKASGDWQGRAAVVDTLEFTGDVPRRQKAAFRAYDSLNEAVRDYGKFIAGQPRYQQALEQGTNARGYAESLQQAGYATDPTYAEKIMSVYNGDRLNSMLPDNGRGE
ncbi:flagellar assembly peptidoglycan hydrolase FlgJ [Alteromonas halophila]|uniref:Peptidoglycan hydrolase FlgJ n=1 Tax=Alteromonas halophila TaxID=516698 RepID=A0A918JD86_9ALTE|nr:flagellar assembly peptidoglycan hydrolase FlgJ [Alteromonas halophila]GGW73417.1 flagellar rod assembly protein/muramidase FlgJ [Alteromonas halophila]